jgi:hypothetical protein
MAETGAIVKESVVKAQPKLWSKLWSTDDTLGVQAREQMSQISKNQCNS